MRDATIETPRLVKLTLDSLSTKLSGTQAGKRSGSWSAGKFVVVSVKTSEVSWGKHSPEKGADGRPGGRDDVDGRESRHGESVDDVNMECESKEGGR